jgi:hypothetical protein
MRKKKKSRRLKVLLAYELGPEFSLKALKV